MSYYKYTYCDSYIILGNIYIFYFVLCMQLYVYRLVHTGSTEHRFWDVLMFLNRYHLKIKFFYHLILSLCSLVYCFLECSRCLYINFSMLREIGTIHFAFIFTSKLSNQQDQQARFVGYLFHVYSYL